MLTLFTIAKPFTGHIGIIQRNALLSWRRALPDSEIVLFGAEAGTQAACRSFQLRSGGDLPRSPTGRYLVSQAFHQCRNLMTGTSYLCYLNCDILIGPDFRAGWQSVLNHGLRRFLLSARRRKADVQEDLTQLEASDFQRLFAQCKARSPLDGHSAIDMFGFSTDWAFDLPSFSVGDVAWDNWMIRMAKESGVPVVDGSADITLLHQEHQPSIKCAFNPERSRNLALAGDLGQLKTLRDSSLVLRSGRLSNPNLIRSLVRTALDTKIAVALLRLKRARQATSVANRVTKNKPSLPSPRI